MKKTISFLLAATTFLAACNKQEQPAAEPQAYGTIQLTIDADSGLQTKAVSAYTTAQTYETQVNKVQVFVFGSDGKINFYKNLGKSLTGSITTTAGTKTVYAVVNGPDLSTVGALSELEAKAVDLSANSTTASTGFVMAGKNTCTVSGTAASCAITVSRLAARVVLASVTNALPSSYGALKIERVFLSNVVGNQNIAGTASPSTWYNKEGRKDESPLVESHIIDGSTYAASCPTLTFKSVGQSVANGSSLTPSTPYLFYGYANSSTTAPSGFNATFSAQRSVLVVVASVNSEVFYYPVVLDSSTLVRNTTYTVGLTINSLGSKDPNDPVEKGSMNVNITVAGWQAGATYDETI